LVNTFINTYALGFYLDKRFPEYLQKWKDTSAKDIEKNEEFFNDILSNQFDVTLRIIPSRTITGDHLHSAFHRNITNCLKKKGIDQREEVQVALASFKDCFPYKNKFEKENVYTYLTYPNLYDVANYESNFLNNSISTALQYVTPYSAMPAELTSFQKIKIRTTYAAVKRVGTPSPYAIINVNGMEFVEAVMHDQETFNPHWTTIKYVPLNVSQVTIQYALWDDKFPQDDKLKDIRGDDNQKLDFVFDVASHSLSGEVSGVYDSSSNTFTQSNDGNAVTLFITAEKAGNCQLNGIPEPYCPNEAYTDLRVYAGCGFEDSGSAVALTSTSLLILLLLILA